MLDALRESLAQVQRADHALTLLLDFCTRYTSHAIIAAVSQQQLRAYAVQGFDVGINGLRNPTLLPRPDGYLNQVCQGKSYYHGPASDPELTPWYLDLIGRVPVDVLIIPISLGSRTPLLALLDNGTDPIDARTPPQIFPAIHMVAARLEKLLASATSETPTQSVTHTAPTQPVPTISPPPAANPTTAATQPAVSINAQPSADRMTRQSLSASDKDKDKNSDWEAGLWTRPRVKRPPADAPAAPAAPSPPPTPEEDQLDIDVDIDDTHWSDPNDASASSPPPQTPDRRRLYLSNFGREETPPPRRSPAAPRAAAPAPQTPAQAPAHPPKDSNKIPDKGIDRPPTTPLRPQANNRIPMRPSAPPLVSFEGRNTSSGGLLDLSDDIEPIDLSDDIEPISAIAPVVEAPVVEIDYEYWIARLDHADPSISQQAIKFAVSPTPQALAALIDAFPGRLLIDRFKHDRDMPPASEHSTLLACLLAHGERASRSLIHQTLSKGLDESFYTLLFFLESGDLSILPHIYKHLFSRDPQTRNIALRLIRKHRRDPIATELCSALRQNLKSTQLRVVELSLQSLATLREASAIPDLILCLDHANARIVDSAHQALCAIALEDPGPNPARWTKWFAANPIRENRTHTVAQGLLHADRHIRQLAADELLELAPHIPFHPDDSRADRLAASEALLQRSSR